MSGEQKLTAAHKPDRIDPTFRNGSLTAIGVVVGFSLGFVSNWALQPGTWNIVDIVSVLLIGIGIGLQIRALAGMLSTNSLNLAIYERLIRTFLIGLGLVAFGVGMAIFGDVVSGNLNVPHKP